MWDYDKRLGHTTIETRNTYKKMVEFISKLSIGFEPETT
jgi:hypothetical protein